MAALDFGMAKARGIFAGTTPEMEKELLRLAGGKKNTFKSEAFWSQQVTKLIKEGLPKYEKGTEFKTRSGDFVLGKRQRQYVSGYNPTIGNTDSRIAYAPPRDAVITGYGGSGFFVRPIYETRSVDVITPERTELTQAQLDKITQGSKDSLKRTKADLEKLKASRKRLTRGTGGLVAKAALPGTEGMATGMPILGETGLGLTSSLLGQKQKL